VACVPPSISEPGLDGTRQARIESGGRDALLRPRRCQRRPSRSRGHPRDPGGAARGARPDPRRGPGPAPRGGRGGGRRRDRAPGGESVVAADDMRLARLRMQGLVDQMAAGVARIEAQSITLRDISEGLVDFPALVNGRQVWLCWKRGEGDIAYWHDLESGFSG